MEALDVEPSVLLEVENFATFLVDFSVPMRPYTCLVETKQGVHSCPKKAGMIFFPEKIQKSCHSVLHCVFEKFRRFEGRVSLYFHDVQLELFPESEVWQLNEVYDSPVEVFYDLVHTGSNLQ